MQLYGKTWSRRELLKYFGDLAAIAGVTHVTGEAGTMQSVPVYIAKTGTGLAFNVIPGRAMDIAEFSYKGIPLGYMTKNGIKHASYSLQRGNEWLRNFFGGALTTCGLTHVGPPEIEGNWELPCHGRISGTPADEISCRSYWQDDDWIIQMEGKMRESVFYEENLMLHRTIRFKAGESRFFIEDTVENMGFCKTPFMLLYHMNFGYPVFSKDSIFILPAVSTVSAHEEFPDADWQDFRPPSQDEPTRLYFHSLACGKKGGTGAALYNPKIKLGVYIRYDGKSLPCFSQWKNMQCQDYVMGLEPGNCYPLGRKASRQRGELRAIDPGETQRFSIELGVLDGEKEMQAFRDYINE